MKSSQSEVELLLSDMRKAIEANSYTFAERKKNMRTLASLAITVEDAVDELYELTYDDYISGPDEDRNNSSSDNYWVFKKSVYSRLIYIKLKVLYLGNRDLFIMSFHINDID